MTPVMRIGLLLCMLTFAGIGLMCAVAEAWGMAAIFVCLCWGNRPDVLKRKPSGGAS